MILRRATPDGFDDWAGLHRLLTTSFAYMEGRIDPPSSLHQLSPEGLRDKAGQEDCFIVPGPDGPLACVFGAVRDTHYYIGKLATAPQARGQGLASALLDACSIRARALGQTALVLQTRVELVENHAYFRAQGFVQTASTSHPGYDRVTSLTFVKPLPPAPRMA